VVRSAVASVSDAKPSSQHHVNLQCRKITPYTRFVYQKSTKKGAVCSRHRACFESVGKHLICRTPNVPSVKATVLLEEFFMLYGKFNRRSRAVLMAMVVGIGMAGIAFAPPAAALNLEQYIEVPQCEPARPAVPSAS
jgi:hypothetical protein